MKTLSREAVFAFDSFRMNNNKNPTPISLLRLVVSFNTILFRSWFSELERVKATLFMVQSDIFHGSSAPNGQDQIIAVVRLVVTGTGSVFTAEPKRHFSWYSRGCQ